MASGVDVPPASSAALSRSELEDSLLALAVEARALLGIVPSSYTPRGKVDGIDTFDVDRRHVPAHGLEGAGLGEQERDHPSHRFAMLGTGVRLYPPSALEFARVYALHAPAVFAGVPEALFPFAWQKWDDTKYLISRMGDRKVKVAFTPNGRADDIVTLPSGSEGAAASTDGKVFALPYEAEITFRDLFAALHPPAGSDAPAAYLQSQNNNLCSPESSEGDFAPLLEDLLRTTAASTESPPHAGAPEHAHPHQCMHRGASAGSASTTRPWPAAASAREQDVQASLDAAASVRARLAHGGASSAGARGAGSPVPTTSSSTASAAQVEGAEHPQPRLLDVPFASAVYGVPPEAVNVWFGTAASASSLHKDHYENLMVVLRGTKVFTLIPPWENAWIEDDKVYPVYRWARRAGSGPGPEARQSEDQHDPGQARGGVPVAASELYLVPEPGASTPWITVDPTLPPTSGRNRSEKRYARGQRTHLVSPIRVVVRAGETLYLPAGWYHHVAQGEDVRSDPMEACAIGLNFWYDTPLTDRWAWSNFASTLRQEADGTHVSDKDKADV